MASLALLASKEAATAAGNMMNEFRDRPADEAMVVICDRRKWPSKSSCALIVH